MKTQLFAFLLAASLVASGCSQSSPGGSPAGEQNASDQQVNSAAETAPVVVENFLADESALKSAQEALQDLPNFKGKELQVFQSPHFYNDGRIIIMMQDPQKSENVDEYTYSGGGWQEAVPVRLEGDGDMKDNVTPLKDMPFASIAKMRATWTEKAKGVEGAADKPLSHIYVNINPVTAKRRWFCDDIEGTREAYSLIFNLDGTVESFEKK